jgi:hypothetical protein
MGQIIRLTSSFVRPASATQYTAGDEISSSATAGSVVRMTFNLSGFTRGRIIRAGLSIAPASGNVVITASNMNMLLFKTADAPAAVGDNVTHPITGAQRALAVGNFLFDDGGWVNPLGAFAASTSAWQQVPDTMLVPYATPDLAHSDGANFDFAGSPIGSRTLTAVMQVLAAWNPGNVANTFGAVIDVIAE